MRAVRTSWIVAAALLAPCAASAAIETQNLNEPEKTEAPEPVLTKAPELIEFVHAAYPAELVDQGVSGGVVLHIDIDERGRVSRVQVLSTDHVAFNEPAMVAATHFVFSPAEVDYAPAAIRIEYRYVFEAQLPEPDVVAGLFVSEELAAREVNFRGVIREAGTRLPVSGATIFVEDRAVAESALDGTFEVPGAPVDSAFSVRVSGAYHHTFKARETVGTDEIIDVTYYLYRSARDPYETVVRSEREQREVSKITMSRRELSRVAGTSGDPIRAIENLPGMGRPSNNLGTLLVRGSSPQDSKVFIDGMEVPLLYHFGGLTSVVSRYMLDSIDVLPGAFPARYGNATGGVVDIKTRELDCNGWQGAGEPSTAILSAYTCYPITENIRIAGAARRSLIDLYLPEILKAVQSGTNAPDEGAIIVTPAYADYQLKLEAKFDRHTLSLFAFGSDDTLVASRTPSTERLDFDFGFHQGFHRIMLKHRWRLTDHMNLTTSVAPGVILTEFNFNIPGVDGRASIYNYNMAVREDFDWEFIDGWTVRAGFDGTFGQTDLAFEFPLPDELRQFPTPAWNFGEPAALDYRLPRYNHAYWADAVIEPGGGVQLVPGVRFSRWDFHHTQRLSLEARANARWEFLDGMTVKAAYGLHERLPDVQNLLDRPFGNPELHPERSHQFIVGYEHEFTDLINVDVQTYYYRRERLTSPALDVELRDGQRIPLSFLNTGAGETIGLEVMLRHLATPPRDLDTAEPVVDLESFLDWMNGRFYGWIAYTLSQTLRRDHLPGSTYDLDVGPGLTTTLPYSDWDTQQYPAAFDQTHILTIVGQVQLPWNVEGGLRFRLVSGNPYTPLQDGFIGVDMDSDAYRTDDRSVPRNSGRMAYFHQLDVRFDKEVVFELFKLEVFLEITNVYAANNVDQMQYDYRYRGQITTNLLPFPFMALGVLVTW